MRVRRSMAALRKYKLSFRFECTKCGWHKRFNVWLNLNWAHWVYVIEDYLTKISKCDGGIIVINYDLSDTFVTE
jgi:hypothetical protein